MITIEISDEVQTPTEHDESNDFDLMHLTKQHNNHTT